MTGNYHLAFDGGEQKMLSMGHSMFLCTIFKFHLGCREVWKYHFLFFLRTVVFAILVLGRWLNAFGATLSHCAGRDTSYNANLPTLSSPACGHFCPLYPPPLLPFCGHQSQALRLMKHKFAKILPRAIFSILGIDHWLDVR